MAALLGFCLLVASAVRADVLVSPSSQRIAGRPGSMFQFRIRLFNTSARQADAAVIEVRDIQQRGAMADDYPLAGLTRYSCASWLKAVPPTVELRPREERYLTVQGRIPSDAKGSHHCALMIQQRPPTTPTPSAGAVLVPVLRLAFGLDVVASGTGRSDVKVSDLDLASALEMLGPFGHPETRAALRGKLAAKLAFTNTGNTAAWVSGYLHVREKHSGRIVQRVAVGTEQPVRVLPESTASSACVLPAELPIGDYRVELHCRYGDLNRRIQAERDYHIDGPASFQPIGSTLAETEAYSVTVRPARIDAPLSPGITTARSLVVKNEDPVAMHCTAEVQGFSEEPDGTRVETPDESLGQAVVQPAGFDLAAGGSALVRVSVTPGAQLDPRVEHYWMVKITARPVSGKPGAVALGSTMVVAADRRQLQPGQLAIAAVKVLPELETTTIRLALGNTGGTAVLCRGALAVSDSENGSEIASVPFGENDEMQILAGSTRQLVVVVPRAMQGRTWRCQLRFANGVAQPNELSMIVHPPAPAAGSAEPGSGAGGDMP